MGEKKGDRRCLPNVSPETEKDLQSSSGKGREKEGKGCLREAAGTLLLAGACAGAGAVLGAAAYCYRDVMEPQKHDPRLDEEPAQKEFAAGRRWAAGHPLRQDVYLKADDGLQLHGIFIPAREDSQQGASVLEASDRPASSQDGQDGGVRPSPSQADGGGYWELKKKHGRVYAVCVHGSADALESMGIFARVYNERYGMNVVLPDLRGHGKSDGDHVGMGYEDCRDLLHWIDWILERDGQAQIVLHGVSMGAAAVLMTTGENLPEQVMAAVSDSCYTRADEIVTGLCEKNIRRLPGRRRSVWTDLAARALSPVLGQSVRAIALVRAGYDIALASPVEAVAVSKTPTLFIHGQADDIVPPKMMPALYRAASCPKAFLWIPEAGHGLSAAVDPETYWSRIERFLHAHDVEL